ncbi:hypothetical protein CEXT_703571 [Caerostris extrusa]|uniref:Uncharacterized protein n=1 Tax=Caerostris extrusa TaxID=172846 RepID=A0AAV4MXS4_CAEEX|nr:hypothetical protein CEXT_703571 [Caerostris extrusa]
MHQKGKSEQDIQNKTPNKKTSENPAFCTTPLQRADDAWTGMRYIDGTLMESSPDATGRVLLKQPQRPPSDERETSPLGKSTSRYVITPSISAFPRRPRHKNPCYRI